MKNGYDGRCKVCRKAYHNNWYQQGDNRKKKSDYGKKHYLKKYGLTIAQRDQMLVDQKFKCAICNIYLDGSSQRLIASVDHNHTTGEVRGLLCGNCNTALGLFYESEDTLLNAISYLKRYNG